MNKTRIIPVGAVLLALALLFVFSSDFFLGTGFFTLAGEEAELPQEEPKEEKLETLGASLSYEVLKKTSIEASLSEFDLKDCPVESEVEITMKNTGPGEAEKVFLEFGDGIKVVGCTNCNLDSLGAGESAAVEAIVCLETSNSKSVLVGSANSNSVEIGFQE